MDVAAAPHGPDSPLMVATCWTSAGNVAPMQTDERSPIPFEERVQAIAATGWRGLGLAQDDLREIRDTIGFAAARDLIAEAGLARAVSRATAMYSTHPATAAISIWRRLLEVGTEQRRGDEQGS